MATKNEVALLIAQVIEDYSKISITTADNQLIISDRTGTTTIPLGSSRTGTTQTSTFR